MTDTTGTAVAPAIPTVAATTPVAPVQLDLFEKVDAEYDTIKADIEADFVKAKSLASRFGLAFVTLIVGWILAKIF